MTRGEFATSPLVEPISYATVGEGCYQAAGADARYDYLATFGIYTCKGITLHNQDTSRGVLAHLDGTTRLSSILDTVVNAYQDDLSTADIRVVQATVSEDTLLWPNVDAITDYFASHNPRSLLVDKNSQRLTVRGIALNLRSGEVFDADYQSTIMRQSRETMKPSLPLRRAS